MKKLVIVWMIGMLLPFVANAQLGKQMSKYHEKNGVTVTQLDKSLYGLYQRENLSPETKDMLQKLDEVNILNLNAESCEPELTDKIISQFRNILDNADKYRLVKSRNDGFSKQLIYAQSKNGKIEDLVVWNQSPAQLDIIELRGDIELNRIALLSRALNLQGLGSLAMLSPDADDLQPDDIDAMRQAMRSLKNMGSGFFDGFGDAFDGFFRRERDTTQHRGGFTDPFGAMDRMMNMFDGFDDEQLSELMKQGGTQHMQKFFQSFGDGENVSSSSVQITEENGKTKLKIDSKNTDITYIIDGKQAPKDKVQMPERIVNVNIIPSKEDVKKSYLFITSQDKLGNFTSYKDDVLTFQYDNQEYKFNLDKATNPLLVIDGRLSSTFNIDPADILQIRPISQIEKEVGYYPNAEVIVNTK